MSDLVALVCSSHSFSLETPRMVCSSDCTVPSQRFFPHASVHNSSAAAESQLGMWTPLVTCPMGTSASGQPGKSGSNRRRLTFPCSRLTPLALPHPRIARYAMLNGSDGSEGLRRPRASSSCGARPSWAWAYPPRYCSTSDGANRSNPAATAVWVVNRLPARVTASATSKDSPVCVMNAAARSSTAKAACPSLRWQTSGRRPSSPSRRHPPIPRTISWTRRSSGPPP